jgi:AraC-like DNA-binding protein
MDLVFATDPLPPRQRYAAWRDAICHCYVHVDVRATRPDEYRGFVREARYGDVVLTDILLSEQHIRRERRHIARLDKDCFYVQLVQQGRSEVIQRGGGHRSNAARGAIFSAVEPYELRFAGRMRAFYLELPRERFCDRFPRARIPVVSAFQTTRGLGRVAAELCATLAAEDHAMNDAIRARLGEQLMDLLALTLMADEGDQAQAEGSVREARLRSIQRWIDDHLADPGLRLEQVATANHVSLRYLHALFKLSGMSVSEWICNRRLQRSYDALATGRATSVTAAAFENGFANSSHFSTLFRRRYGVPPREVLRADPPRTGQIAGDRRVFD